MYKGSSILTDIPSNSVIRQLWPIERNQWRDHLLRLSKPDRKLRFAGSVSDASIHRYCESADMFSTSLVGYFVDGVLRGVGEIRIVQKDWPHTAELAFSVEEGFQCQGIGTELFRRLVMAARNRAVQQVLIVSEQNNLRMRRLACKFGMSVSSNHGEIEGRLELHGPNYASVVQELFEESAALIRSLSAVFGMANSRDHGTIPESL